MERRHQPKQGHHQSEAKDGRESHHPHCRRRVETLEPSKPSARLPKSAAHLVSMQEAFPKRKLKEPSAIALSDDQDYVQRWLAQTDSSSKPEREENGRMHNSPRYQSNSRTSIDAFHTDCNTRVALTDSKRKRKSSSDSSILEALPRLRQAPHVEIDAKRKFISSQDDDRASLAKKQRLSSPSSETSRHSSTSSPRRDKFERKPRHKTREDRYEPRKDKHTKRSGEEKQRKKKRETKTERKRAVKKAGEDLMRNFSSKSIGQERLTMRPSQSLGLFNNGRASSPAKRRGVPNLAFSEMEFLQHVHRQQLGETTLKGKSKSRETEKRKKQRAQEEIARFFQPKGPSLPKMHSKNLRPSSSENKDKDSIYSWQHVDDRYPAQIYQPRLSSQDLSELRDGSKATQRRQFLTQISPVKQSLPSINNANSRPAPGPISKSSGRATSYISWSSSHHTSTPGLQTQLILNERPNSPIPECVRLSIERTGIFKDTGIGFFERSKFPHRNRSSQGISSERLRPPTSPSRGEPCTQRELTAVSAPPITQQLSILPELPQARNQIAVEHTPAPGVSHESDISINGHQRGANPAVETNGTQYQDKRNLQFELDLGWHRKSRSPRPALVTEQEKTQHSDVALPDTAELTKTARIRDESSNLSATRRADNDLLEGGADQPTPLAAPGFVDKAANDTARVNQFIESACSEDRDVGKHEPISQLTVEQLPSGHESQPTQVSRSSSTGHVSAHDRLANFENTIPLDSMALLSKLQTPASTSPHPVAANIVPRTECISHLFLPIKGLSSNRNHSPAKPLSRLTPITELDPLFLRQLNEQDRGRDHSHSQSEFRAERPDRYFEGHMETLNQPEYDTRCSYYRGELVEDYQAGEDFLDNSRDTDHQQHAQYDSYEDLQYFETQPDEKPELQRPSQPDLTPIPEWSEEFENVDVGSWNYQNQDGMDWANGFGSETHEKAPYGSNVQNVRNDVYQTYEAEEEEQMRGFWRPHSRY